MSRTHMVLLYSSSPAVRDAVRTAVGKRPAADLAPFSYVEAGSVVDFLAACDSGEVDVAVLDGEARPAGGLGLARQVKDELRDCPPVLVLVARADDAWLGQWSQADEVLPHPVDAAAVREAVVRLVRDREAALPVRRSAPL